MLNPNHRYKADNKSDNEARPIFFPATNNNRSSSEHVRFQSRSSEDKGAPYAAFEQAQGRNTEKLLTGGSKKKNIRFDLSNQPQKLKNQYPLGLNSWSGPDSVVGGKNHNPKKQNLVLTKQGQHTVIQMIDDFDYQNGRNYAIKVRERTILHFV